MFRVIAALVALLALAVLPAAARAEVGKGVLNKEGYWAVEVEPSGCVAAIDIEGGTYLAFRVVDGEVAFGVFAKSPVRRGKTAVLSTEAYSFAFEPSFGDSRTSFIFDGVMNARSLAALRLARELSISIDGRPVMGLKVEGTGFEGALDAAIECSKGASGWWGKGAGQQTADAAEAGKPVLHKAGFWSLTRGGDEDGASCSATVSTKSGGVLLLRAEGGEVTFAVAGRRPLKGKKGTFATDAHEFEFPPSFTTDGSVYLDDFLNDRALAALRLARGVVVSLDGRVVLDAVLDGTGFEEVLDSLIACSKGSDGWWGKGVDLAEGASPSAAPPPPAGGSGTAFFISADGLAVTAAHVVNGCKAVSSPRWGPARVLVSDPRADLAVLKLPTASGQFVALRGRGPRLGEPISAGGYPLGQLLGSGLKITTGVVSGLAGPEGDRSLFQLSAPIQPGSSGGPVIDGAGALVGVTAAKLDEVNLLTQTGTFPQNVNFAVPVTILQSFLDENGVSYRTSTATAPAPAAPSMLPSFTFNVTCEG